MLDLNGNSGDDVFVVRSFIGKKDTAIIGCVINSLSLFSLNDTSDVPHLSVC